MRGFIELDRGQNPPIWKCHLTRLLESRLPDWDALTCSDSRAKRERRALRIIDAVQMRALTSEIKVLCVQRIQSDDSVAEGAPSERHAEEIAVEVVITANAITIEPHETKSGRRS